MPSAPAPPPARVIGVQAYLDLATRARNGIAVHLPLWLIVGGSGALWATLPSVYLGSAAVFALLMLARLAFEQGLAARAALAPSARLGFTLLLLANPLLWGVLAALSIGLPEMAGARPVILIACVGVGASGGMSLVIEPLIGRLYPLLVIAPITVMLLVNGDRASAFTAAMALLSTFYVQRASRVVHADYWSAVDAQAELTRRAAQLERLSVTDALTAVHNRPHFDRRLSVEWARAQRSGAPLSLLMVDLDHFKRINDQHGHAFGDACLKATAAALRDALHRPGDLLARYGGEEFVVLLPGVDPAGARVVADRLCRTVSEIVIGHGAAAVALSCSIGVHTTTRWRGEAGSAGSAGTARAMELADQAMYAAKRQGRNRVVATHDAGAVLRAG